MECCWSWSSPSPKFGLHMIFNNRYGNFRDEFDYTACGDHLAWGYVDQPSLAPFLMRVSRELLAVAAGGAAVPCAASSAN